MKIGLYFGSFNPIHKGHLSIARYMLNSGYCQEVWIIVSPQSPFKQTDTLAADTDRLKMAKLAVEDEELCNRVKVSDIEMNMPRPSWTIDTLRLLISQYPQHTFAIIMGEDNLIGFDRWKEHDEIVRLADILVYPREGVATGVLNAPLLEYSSTKIRENIKNSDPIDIYVTTSVEKFINEKGIYMIDDNNVDALLERGKTHLAGGYKGAAMNDFLRVLELTDNNHDEAQGYVDMINDIFNYTYKDTYNP